MVSTAKSGSSPFCRARSVSDLAPVLMLLNARLRLLTPGRERDLVLENAYLHDGIISNRLERNELLTEIAIPMPLPTRVTYEKLRIRNAIDFPSVGMAVAFEVSTRGLSVCYTGVNTHPTLLRFLESDFTGFLEMVDKACEDAMRAAHPLKQDLFSPSYRREMIGVLIRRSLPLLKKSFMCRPLQLRLQRPP